MRRSRQQGDKPSPGWQDYYANRSNRMEELYRLLQLEIEVGSKRAVQALILIAAGVLLSAAVLWAFSLSLPLAILIRLVLLILAAAALLSSTAAILFALLAARIRLRTLMRDSLEQPEQDPGVPTGWEQFSRSILQQPRGEQRRALLTALHHLLLARRRQEQRLRLAFTFFALAVLIFSGQAILSGISLLFS
jgi:fatty acid desaturase